MRVKEFANLILEAIAHLQEKDDKFECLVSVMSGLSFENFVTLLKKLSTVNDKVTPAALKPLGDYLAEYGNDIKLTPGCFTLVETPANLASFIVAHNIGFVTGDHPYDLMMPTIEKLSTNQFWYRCKLNEFMIGKNSIPVLMQNLNSDEKYNFYGEEGRKKIAKGIVKQIAIKSNTLQIKPREVLIKTLLQHVTRENSENFLFYFDLKDLSKIVFENDSLARAIENREMYNGDEKHDKAVFFLQVHIEEKSYPIRKRQKEARFAYFFETVKQHLGEYSHYFLNDDDDDKYLAASRLFKEFLLSDAPLPEIDEFLQQHKSDSWPIREMFTGLNKIYNQTKLVSDPSYFVQQEPSRLNKLGTSLISFLRK